MGKFRDLTGQRSGRLIVIKEHGRNKQGKAVWLCQCECGNLKTVYSYSLISKTTLSCGCLQKEVVKERSITHNKTKTRLYKTWANIKTRCYNPKFTYYKYYGGRGIKMCDEWQAFEAFHAWAITSGYSDNLTIERIKNDGNYEPGNCKWVTMKEQANNKSSNQNLSYAGKTQTLKQWSEEIGISYYALIQRLHLGWSAKEILTTKIAN